jgi:hypothetical protein
MTSGKILDLKTARHQRRQKAAPSLEKIVSEARKEYARLKAVADSEPANLASGDPTKIHEEQDDDEADKK